MKKILIVLILLPLNALFALAEIVELNNSEEPISVEILSSDLQRTVIKYSVNSYLFDKITIDGKQYSLMQKLRKESMILEKGYPQLPRVNRSIIISDDGVVGYEIISSKYIEINDIDIAPSKGILLRTIDPNKVPYEFADVYTVNSFYPAELVTIREPFILRDYRGVNIELNAFQYNPVTRTLKIYTDVTIEIEKKSPGGENVFNRTVPLTSIDPQFDKIYRARFENYSLLDYPPLLESGGMLIICYDDFIEEMTPFVDWKIQRGISTDIVPVSEAGANPDQIKTYIRNSYLSSDLTYVLFVGDAAQIPTFSENNDSDPVYSLLAGNDNYPEIFVGRFSAENSEQLQTQIDRTINYERFPDPAGEWYSEGLVIGSITGPFPEHNNEYDFTHMTNIAYKLLNHSYTQVDSSYEPWCTMQGTLDIINDGRSILFYAGHGGPEGWGTSGISTAEVFDLVNTNMLPHVNSVACNTGQFVQYTCLGESWLRATHEITGEPTGGIGFYGSVEGMTGAPPLDMQDEAIDLLVADSMFTLGGICFSGSMLMIDNYGLTGAWEFKNLTVFGDPSVSLRGGSPFEPIVAHNPLINVGASSLDLTVVSSSVPVRGAMVCGMNEEVYATGITNASGQTSLLFNPPISQTGTLNLTVSGGDMIPYIVEIDIVDSNSAFVVYSDHEIQDDLTGNNNGQLDYSETVELGVTLANEGTESALNISAIITTENPLVTISRDSIFIEEILAGGNIVTDRAFEFTTGSELNNNDPVIFTLTVSDELQTWESTFSIPVHAPEIVFSSLIIDDSGGGNGDSLLSAGESADLIVSFVNAGSLTGEDISAVLTCANPMISINTGIYEIGEILSGSLERAVFNVSAGPLFYPPGSAVDFSVNVTGALGYTEETGFMISVGSIVNAPTGPDLYGYYAYDQSDPPALPQYQWVELVPDSGGTGQRVPFTLLDEVYYLELPFAFQYYGVVYDSLTVSTKAYLTMGVCDELDYTASNIPDPDGPPAMIAACWCDLDPVGTTVGGDAGGVWYKYDERIHALVIQYNYAPMYAGEDHATFEILILDPEYYPTTTGDGQIKMQFKDPFDSAPVCGIENQTEDVGLLYGMGTYFPLTSAPIVSGTAILFTTSASSPQISITMTPASTPIIIPADGGSFDFSVQIENDGINTIIFDAWFDVILPDSSIHSPILCKEGLFLDPGLNMLRSLTQTVPASAPAGEYVYQGHVGIYPDAVFSGDCFPFEKSAGDGSEGKFTGWILSGWDGFDEFADIQIPDSYALHQNYPNPFNPSTFIKYDLPYQSRVKLEIFNILGQKVVTLIDGSQTTGYKSVRWNADRLASGMYIYQIKAESLDGKEKYSSIKKMVLIK